MILRRIADAFRTQDWFTVLVETLIVVLGVYLGLQVNTWNDARIERKQEREFLVNLHEDFVEGIAGQTRDLQFLAQQLSDQAAILKALNSCALVPEQSEAFQRGVNTLGFINPPRLFRRTIDEMAAAGKNNLIQNNFIKEKLAKIVGMVEWRSAGFDQISRLTEHYRFIVEEQVVYDIDRTYNDPFLGSFFGVTYDINTLCQEIKTASAISAISNITQERRRAYLPILDEYNALLPMLEAELHNRWNVNITEETIP